MTLLEKVTAHVRGVPAGVVVDEAEVAEALRAPLDIVRLDLVRLVADSMLRVHLRWICPETDKVIAAADHITDIPWRIEKCRYCTAEHFSEESHIEVQFVRTEIEATSAA